MPFTGRDEDDIVIINHSLKIKAFSIVPHFNEALTLFDPDKLINEGMHFQTNIFPDIDAH